MAYTTSLTTPCTLDALRNWVHNAVDVLSGGDAGQLVSTTTTLTAQPVPPAPPTVTGLAPATGPIAGGTVVSVTGTNLGGATAVKFGATAATAFTVISATTIHATSPAEAAGAVDVTVTTPGGTSATSASDKFTYT